MAFKDWTQSMWDKIKARSPFMQDDQEANLANGGFGGYRPNTAKQRALRETQQMPVAEQPQVEFPTANMNWAPQQMEQPTAFGGFTGMMPPQATAYQQQTAYQQPAPQQTAYQPTGYQNMGATMAYQPMNASWQQPYEQQPMGGYGNTVMFPNQAPQQPVQPQQPKDNISYIPGNFVGDDGRAYRHCERIAVVSSVSGCYSVLEFMRNRETVILNTEPITDEAENQRCLDMIYGASKALRCSFTRIAGMSIYLVAPEEVMVMPNKTIHRMSDEDIASRWPQQEYAPRRDRYDRYGQPQQEHSRQAEYSQGYQFRRAAGYR